MIELSDSRSVSPDFSLVVGTLGRAEPLARLLSSLRQQGDATFEVIIVDQNDGPVLAPVLDQFGDLDLKRIVSSRGLSRARNAGLALVRGQVICFPDDDCWYSEGLLPRVSRLFGDERSLDIVSGRTIDLDGCPSVSPTGPLETEITRSNFLTCGNSNTLFFRRSAVERIGEFDDRLGVGSGTAFGSGEEADYLLRAFAEGLTARYIPKLHVFHEQVDAEISERTIDRAGRYGAGFGALMRKHRFGFGYFAYRQARTLARCALFAAQGDLDRAHYKWRWLRGVSQGYYGWIRASSPES